MSSAIAALRFVVKAGLRPAHLVVLGVRPGGLDGLALVLGMQVGQVLQLIVLVLGLCRALASLLQVALLARQVPLCSLQVPVTHPTRDSGMGSSVMSHHYTCPATSAVSCAV